MRARSRFARPGLPLIVLVAFLAVLWVAGGASRGNVPAQILVRAAATVALVVMILFGPRPDFKRARAALLAIVAVLCLLVLQLLPLPYDWWRALPTRDILSAGLGDERAWLPLTVTPSGSRNALASLLIPVTVLIAMVGVPAREQRLVLSALIVMVVCAAVFGLFQFTLGYFDNPLFNDTPWQVNGPFANRNHFALFLAVGCLLVMGWAFADHRRFTPWSVLAVILTVFFLLMILATGSRAGLLAAAFAVLLGAMMSRRAIRRQFRDAPRWALPAFLSGAVALVVIVLLVSMQAGRAVSLDRLLAADGGAEDMRTRALPTLFAMIKIYFPFGSGAGSFDPVFRMHEPFALLKPTYFNHAHNDFLEVAIEAGIPGLLILAAAIGWWAAASIRAWRGTGLLPRLGSSMLFLIFVASAFDYPARTPTIMALIVIAAVWLDQREQDDPSALPRPDQQL